MSTNLKEEAATYIAMVYPCGLKDKPDQRLEIEAAFIAGAARAATLVSEKTVSQTARSIVTEAHAYVDAAIAKQMAYTKRN